MMSSSTIKTVVRRRLSVIVVLLTELLEYRSLRSLFEVVKKNSMHFRSRRNSSLTAPLRLRKRNPLGKRRRKKRKLRVRRLGQAIFRTSSPTPLSSSTAASRRTRRGCYGGLSSPTAGAFEARASELDC